MDLLKFPSSRNQLFESDNLCILAFNTRVTQSLNLTIIGAINVTDYSHKWGKSLMLVISGENLFQVFAFIFIICP